MEPAGLTTCLILAQLILGSLGTSCGGEAPELRAESGIPGQGPFPVYLATRAPAHDFGEVWEGTVLEHEFALKVMGTEDLVIESVSADCGCTVPSLEVGDTEEGMRQAYATGDPLQPGSWLFLQVEYNTRGKLGSTPRNVHVIGNLPGGRTQVLVQADVRRWLAAAPPRVDLPELFVDDQTETRFEVSSPDGTPFRLRHTELGVPPQVKVELVPRESDDEERAALWDVLVTLGPDLPLGSHGYPIQLVSDVPNPDALRAEDGAPAFFSAMPFVGVRVVGLVSVAPGRMTFGMIRPGETVSRTVRVSSNDSDFELGEPAVRLEPMRPGDDFPLGRTAELSVRPVEGENAWDVQLLLSELDPEVTRTFLARLVLDTGHPQEPSIQVPVTGFHLQASGQGGGK
jgi:hypothetical protein